MKKVATILIMSLLLVSFSSEIFAESNPQKEKIVIPKTGMLSEPYDLGNEVIVYRNEVVVVTAEKKTTIAPNGDFIMYVHVLPSGIKTKTEKWFDYVRWECSRWTSNEGRIPASPMQVDEILFKVAINETDATWKIYGVKMFDLSGDKRDVLFSKFENANVHFNAPYKPLDYDPLFDAAYRKLIQWHKEH